MSTTLRVIDITLAEIFIDIEKYNEIIRLVLCI
jgi:hypothetical protein